MDVVELLPHTESDLRCAGDGDGAEAKGIADNLDGSPNGF